METGNSSEVEMRMHCYVIIFRAYAERIRIMSYTISTLCSITWWIRQPDLCEKIGMLSYMEYI